MSAYNTQPKIIAVASHKGGSGRTTLALNLAAAWSEAEHKTLVIDLDPRQGASLWALHTHQVTPKFTPLTMVLAGLTESDEEGSSPIAEIISQAKRADAERLIIDLPALPDYRSLAALRAADIILIPASGSALDSDLTASTIRHIRENMPEYSQANLMIAPIAEAEQPTPAELRAFGLTLAPAIHRSTDLAQGLAAPGSTASQEIKALAQFVEEKLGTPAQALAMESILQPA